MTEQLDEPWGRFDLDFPNDERFLAMPSEDELRGKAYLLLLALGGRSVLDRTDGGISQAVFADLAGRLWPDTAPGLLWDALIARRVGLIRRTSTGLALTRQSKWQRTRAEILAAIDAGRRGAAKRWSSVREVENFRDSGASVSQREGAATSRSKRKGAVRGPHGEPNVGDPIAEQSRKRAEQNSVSNLVPEGTRPAEPDSEALVLTSPISRTPAEQVFDAWIQATGRSGRTQLDPKRGRLIAQALKAYPLEDVLDAVRGWRHSPHHRGENDRTTVYNELELLLRDASHIEQFRDLERHAPRTVGLLPSPRKSALEMSIDRDLSEAARLRQEGR